MKPWKTWLARLGIAGACFMVTGCGGGDVPDASPMKVRRPPEALTPARAVAARSRRPTARPAVAQADAPRKPKRRRRPARPRRPRAAQLPQKPASRRRLDDRRDASELASTARNARRWRPAPAAGRPIRPAGGSRRSRPGAARRRYPVGPAGMRPGGGPGMAGWTAAPWRWRRAWPA